jgi:hypothetical protein
MSATSKNRWLFTVVLFAIVYFLVGFAFPNPPGSNPTQFWWRLASWVVCGAVFALHIGLEQLRFRNSPLRTSLHASASVAIGAFALAVAANIHALTAGTGNQRLLAMALVIWPILAGLPAFMVAWAVAVGLARMRPNDTVGRA